MNIQKFDELIQQSKFAPKSIMILHEHFVKGLTVHEIAAKYSFDYQDLCQLIFDFQGNNPENITHIELSELGFQHAG